MAHIRGGAELGYDWWKAAIRENQKNKYEDYIACAEHLIKENYTSAGNIVASGRSSGGKLVTTAANMRPDLFKVIILGNPSVGLFEAMLNSNYTNTCNTYEYGNLKEKQDFEIVSKHCPYMNIQKGPYPSVYLINGLHDWRVDYRESLKFIAKLREYKTNDSIILIKTGRNRGHFYPSDRFALIRETSEEYSFIFKEFGLNVVAEERKSQVKS